MCQASSTQPESLRPGELDGLDGSRVPLAVVPSGALSTIPIGAIDSRRLDKYRQPVLMCLKRARSVAKRAGAPYPVHGGRVDQERELTVNEASKELRLSKRMVFYRIRRNDIKARRVGWQWLITESEIALVRDLEWYKQSRLLPA